MGVIHMVHYKYVAKGTAAAIGSTVLALAAAHAGQGVDIASFDIGPQKLSAALSKFAQQSQLELVYSPEIVVDRTSGTARGELPPLEALGTLLRDTGLTYTTTSGGAVVVRLAQATKPATPTSATTASPTVASERTEEVIVTGSRIVRRDYVANSPIVTVPQDQLQNSAGFALENQLNQLPQFAGGGSQFGVAPGAVGAGVGQSTLNLRNLGDNRNLVLLDGRRLQPSAANFSIDINTIPAAIIESVEVISGGASAVYGSDAMSGVVNFKTRQRFSGLQLNGEYGVAERGDGQTYNASALLGGNFADNGGNAFVAIDYSQRDATLQGDRDFFTRSYRNGTGSLGVPFLGFGGYKPTGNAAALPGNFPSQAAIDAYFSSVASNYVPGSVTPFTTLGFNNDAASLFNESGPLGLYNFQPVPGDLRHSDNVGAFGHTAVLNMSNGYSFNSFPLKRYSLFGRSEVNLNESVTAFVQVAYTHYTTWGTGPYSAIDNFWSAGIPHDALHPVPDALNAILNSRPNPAGPWAYSGAATFAGMSYSETTNNVYQVLTGVKGSIRNTDWTWEAYASHGETDITTQFEGGLVRFSRFKELIESPFYGENYFSPALGRVVCTSGILPFGESNANAVYPNVKYNPNDTVVVGGHTFSRNISQDCLDYISGRPRNNTALKQDIAEATIQGGLAELPAGQMRFAAGASYRRNTFGYTPDALFETRADTSADLAGNFGQVGTQGASYVTEYYGELLLPVLKDLPAVQSLEVDLAARYSKYQQSGANWAYKGDLNWKIYSDVTVRGGYQRAVRAPNVTELFSPQTNNLALGPAAQDPCNTNVGLAYGNNAALNANYLRVQQLCRQLIPASATYNPNAFFGAGASFPVLVGSVQGNPNLQPEKADTTTFGVVYQPSWNLPLNGRFSASVDYYDIDIKGAIGTLSAIDIYQLCFNASGTSNPTYSAANPYCEAISRDPTNGFPGNSASLYANQGGIKTKGVDAQFDFGLDAGPGRVNLHLIANYLDSYQRAVNEFSPFLEYADTIGTSTGAFFQWKTFATLSYAIGPGIVGARARFYDGVDDVSRVTNPASTAPGVHAYNLFDLYGTYNVTEGIQINAGIDNVEDRGPLSIGGIEGQTSPIYYDTLGRRYYVSFKIKL